VAITTDSGVEQGTLNLPNLLPAFFRWVKGASLESCLVHVRHDQRLFPEALRLQGWGHSWGNIMKAVANSSPKWGILDERMRAQCRFWKNRSWRQHVKTCLERANADVDLTVLEHFSVDMAKWRYETIAKVTFYLKRLRNIAENHCRREWFVNTQERALIHDFCRVRG